MLNELTRRNDTNEPEVAVRTVDLPTASSLLDRACDRGTILFS